MTKDLSIETLCGGAVQERINRALRKVSDNILDPNTEAKKKRSISLTLTFIPNETDREDCSVEANVSIKLAPEEVAEKAISHPTRTDSMAYGSDSLSAGHRAAT